MDNETTIVRTYYQVEHLVPGDKLSPPSLEGEWWVYLNDRSIGMPLGHFTLTDALVRAENLRKNLGHKTRLATITVTKQYTDVV